MQSLLFILQHCIYRLRLAGIQIPDDPVIQELQTAVSWASWFTILAWAITNLDSIITSLEDLYTGFTIKVATIGIVEDFVFNVAVV